MTCARSVKTFPPPPPEAEGAQARMAPHSGAFGAPVSERDGTNAQNAAGAASKPSHHPNQEPPMTTAEKLVERCRKIAAFKAREREQLQKLFALEARARLSNPAKGRTSTGQEAHV